MQKARPYEPILLFHRGIDEAVRTLEWLKKPPGVTEEMYRATVSTPEHARSQVNLQFLADMEQAGRRDLERYERRESDERDLRARTAS